MKKVVAGVFFMLMSVSAYAGNYSSWAVPTRVELVSGGVLIHGAFGDPNNCGKANYMYVSETDSRYDSVLSMSLAALMGKREMRLYSSKCTSVGFHWSGNVINQNQNSQAVYIR
jgi:hypothetical protein